VPSNLVELRSYARALASGTRLRVLRVLAEQRALGVAELSARVGLSQPLMSWHLRHLRVVGLVRTRRNGREVRYSLDPERLELVHVRLSTHVAELIRIRRQSGDQRMETPGSARLEPTNGR